MKKTTLLSILIAISFLLASCGDPVTPTPKPDPDPDPKPDPVTSPIDPDASYEGSAYSYEGLNGGKCGFGIAPTDSDVVSINKKQFGVADLDGDGIEDPEAKDRALALWCGASITVTGPKGSKTLLVADALNLDEANAISMPKAAFDEIIGEAPTEGAAKVTWKLAVPETIGPMTYTLKDVNEGFTRIEIRNNRTPILKLECRAPGANYQTFERKDFNAFFGPGLGLTTIDCKLTDIFGSVVEELLIPAPAGDSAHGGVQQFPVPKK